MLTIIDLLRFTERTPWLKHAETDRSIGDRRDLQRACRARHARVYIPCARQRKAGERGGKRRREEIRIEQPRDRPWLSRSRSVSRAKVSARELSDQSGVAESTRSKAVIGRIPLETL